MKFLSPSLLFVLLAALLPAWARAGVVNATWNSPTDVPVTAMGYAATGNSVNLTLNCVLPTGTNLTVVNNTAPNFIQGAFSNLAQGQVVSLSFGTYTYRFVANYYGGTGNDLVLQWANNRLLAWGAADLGNNTSTNSSVPVPVTASGVFLGKTIIAMAQGYDHSLALCSDGTLAIWGINIVGQLGNGTTTDSLVPVAVNMTGVLTGKTIVSISAGESFSVALCSDGSVATWGYNSNGQLGNNSIIDSHIPVLVSTAGVLSGKKVVSVVAGGAHCLALCADGTLAAWGDGASGQLGNNTSSDSHVPVLVTTTGTPLATKTVVSIGAGYSHSLAVCSDGSLAAWGANDEGQLGNNTLITSFVPSAVSLSGKLATAVAGGNKHTLAIYSNGTVAAWGNNDQGQLGDGVAGIKSVPVLVTTTGVLSGKTVTAVAAGFDHSFALCSDGTVATWGYNTYGQLGNNSTTSSNVPVAVSTSALASGEVFVQALSGQDAFTSLGVVAEPPPSVTASTTQQPITTTSLLIQGSGFDPVAANNLVTFNDGAVGTVSAATPTSLTVSLSSQPVTAGSLTVLVTTDGVSSGTPVQVATITPVVTSSTMTVADNSATITINGYGFDPTAGNNTVTFNDGTVGTVSVATPTSLTVTVSTNPTTAGNLTAVVTADGQSSGTAVQVGTVIPVVSSSTANLPANAISFSITGDGFDPLAANNTVTLSNGAVGVVTAATPTSLTVTFATNPTSIGSMTAVVTTDGQSSGAAVEIANVVPSYVLGITTQTEGPAAGSDTVVLTVTPASETWTATANASWLHTSASGTGSANVLFTFDANTGATRTGTLTIAGQTYTVTQAGSTYVAANPIVLLGNGFPNTVFFHTPQFAVDGSGNVYVPDPGHNSILLWASSTNTVSTFVSSGLNTPQGVAVDSAGNLYIADTKNNAIKVWTASTQMVTTVTSTGAVQPMDLALDRFGNLYFTDALTGSLEMWQAVTGATTTLAASGVVGVAVDGSGNVYYLDESVTNSNVLKEWMAATQTANTLTTIAGFRINGVALDGSGNVYLADPANEVIKIWSPATQMLTSYPVFRPNEAGTPVSAVTPDATGNMYFLNAGSQLEEIPRAFVDLSTKFELPSAGSDSLMVLPAGINLQPPFAPSVSIGQTWLTLGTVSGGVIHFNFSANPSVSRSAVITFLGSESVIVTQAGPVLSLQEPAGTALTSGSSTVDFGTEYTGNSIIKTFTIQNNGSSNLTFNGFPIDGANSVDFAILPPPTPPSAPPGTIELITSLFPITPGSSATISVAFTPTATGLRSAAMHLSTNDPATPIFTVALQGAGVLETTNAATSVSSSYAVLNGSANPNGVATTAYFQYGTSTGYGSLTPVTNLGNGSSAVPVSYNVAGLAKGTTYHYRLAISSGGNTYFGADQTFTTAATSPANWHSAQITALTNPALANMADGARTGVAHPGQNLYFYKGTDNNIWAVFLAGNTWAQQQLTTLANVADWLAYDPNFSTLNYQGTDGNLWCVYYNAATAKWTSQQLGTLPQGVTIAGDIVVDNYGGWNNIYYRGSDSHLYAVFFNGSAWVHTAIGGTATVKGSLAIQGNNHLVYYQSTDNNLWCFYYNGKVWTQIQLTTTANVAGTIAVDQVGLTVYYKSNVDNSAWCTYSTGGPWTATQLDASANLSASATSFSNIAPYNANDCTLYLDGNGQCDSLYWNGSQWTHVILGDGGSQLTGGLSLQPVSHWAYARRSDGNVILFYAQ